MNLKYLRDQDLLNQTLDLVKRERNVKAKILKFICEIERRKLYADIGHSSLFEYLTEGLRYSNSSAYRKIEASKLLKEFPYIEKKIENGELSITNLSMAGSRMNRGKIRDRKRREQVMKIIEGKTTREAEIDLFKLTGKEPPKRNTCKRVSEKEVQITVRISNETFEKLKILKSMRKRKKSLSNDELIDILIHEDLQREEKKMVPKTSAPKTTTKDSKKSKSKPKGITMNTSRLKTSTPKSTRYISAETKRIVWTKAKGQCEWTHPKTGNRCKSKINLEYDHIVPYAQGGNSSAENIQLLCRAHNLRRGIKELGPGKMKRT